MKSNTARKQKTTSKSTPKTNVKLRVVDPTISDTITDAEKVVQNTMVFDLQCHAPSFRKKVKSEDIIDDDEIAADMVHVSKDLIDSDALTALRRQKGALVRWLRFQEVPLKRQILRGGMYLIPLDLVEKVDTEVIDFIARRNELIDDLIEKYDALVDKARDDLKEHFNADDYPDEDDLRDAFRVDADWRPSLNIPAALEKVDRQIFERQKTKIEAQWDEAAAEIPQALTTLYQQIIAHAVDRLGEDEQTGKLNTFRDTFLPKIEEFLSTFESRNLTNVEQLNRLADRARKVIKGVTNADLRENMDTRSFVRKEFEKIKTQLDKAVVSKRRKFSLTEAK